MLAGLPLTAAEVPPFTYRRGATLTQARPRVQVLLGLRDRALLLLGFAGAFRRSELVGLDVADVRFVRDGMLVSLRRSKTDQEGAGEQKAIAYGERPESCPVRALQAWLQAAAIASGPLFRRVTCWGRAGEQQLSAQVVALVVKQRALAASLDHAPTPATACVPVWPPPPASRSATSCARPATAPNAWCASTSARASSSATTPRVASDSDGEPGDVYRVAAGAPSLPATTRSLPPITCSVCARRRQLRQLDALLRQPVRC